MSHITWNTPTDGQSYTFDALSSVNIAFNGEIDDKSYNAYRFELRASNSSVKFANDTQTAYTSVLDNDDTFMTSVPMIGAEPGTGFVVITLQGQFGSTWIDITSVDTRLIYYTVNDIPPVMTNIGVVYNGQWRGAIPYVVKNGQWRRATMYVVANGRWKQLNT